MADGYAELVGRVRGWGERAREAGWLGEGHLRRLHGVEHATPADLFGRGSERPLVIALFGGTGVGKSSLLNRLAGEELAQVGVERPTSTEATLYVHESVELARLPPELPVQRVRVRRHRDGERRGVLWIDAPDIDSTREENRRQVLAWLPHVDLLVYVVSPERYRDDAGWRLLLERGGRHGWMFVMNRWDEGQPEQLEDFRRMLGQAGFESPFVLRTCCAPEGGERSRSDDFAQIEATIRQVLLEHGLRELERLGHRARLLDLRAVLGEVSARLGDEERWRVLAAGWQRRQEQRIAELREGLEWPIQTGAQRFARQEAGSQPGLGRHLASALAAASGRPSDGALAAEKPAGGQGGGEQLSALGDAIWDDWAQGKLSELLDQFELELRRAGVAVMPVRGRLAGVFEDAGVRVRRRATDHVRAALLRPGPLWRRALRRVTGFLMVVLPTAALLWVAYNVVAGYSRGSSGAAPFLGADFAVHSVMLVLLSWLLPWLADRALRPNLEQTAADALRRGVAEALEEIRAAAGQGLQEAIDEAHTLRTEARELDAAISSLALRPVAATRPAIGRLLAAPGRLAAARAGAPERT